jgi:hypothetical protein
VSSALAWNEWNIAERSAATMPGGMIAARIIRNGARGSIIATISATVIAAWSGATIIACASAAKVNRHSAHLGPNGD